MLNTLELAALISRDRLYSEPDIITEAEPTTYRRVYLAKEAARAIVDPMGEANAAILCEPCRDLAYRADQVVGEDNFDIDNVATCEWCDNPGGP